MIEPEILDFLSCNIEIKEMVVGGIVYNDGFEVIGFTCDKDVLKIRIKDFTLDDIMPVPIILKKDNKTMMLEECFGDGKDILATRYGINEDFKKIIVL